MTNPHIPPSYANDRQKPQAQYGAALKDRSSRRWDTASVVYYNALTQTYKVAGQRMGLLTDVPRLRRDAGDNAMLPPDTVVAIHDELGYWVIDSVIKHVTLTNKPLLTPSVTEVRGVGGEDPVNAPEKGAASRRSPTDPADVLNGDQVTVGPDGNLMGVLLGGMNVMKSSPMAQVRTHSLQDLVEIISSTYRHITSMGDLQVKNDGGKTSLVWRAGADQQNESGGWTIRLDVGATGDLFNFEVTTPAGNTLAKIHLSADGRLELVGVAGVDVTSGETGVMREEAAGDKTTTVRGAWNLKVKGAVTEEIQAGRTAQVSKNDELTVGNDQRTTVSSNRNTYVGGSDVEKIQGGTQPDAAAVAKKVQTINGHLIFDIANPLVGATPNGQNEIHANNAGGYYFVLGPTANGPWSIVSMKSNSIHLGASGVAIPNPKTGGYTVTSIAPFTAMLYEYFDAMMKVLLQWLDTHTHGSAMGPTSPPVIPSNPLVSNLLPLIKSKRVKIGL